MTNQGLGSSLFQARKKHYHRHAHLHDRKINHVRSHEDIQDRDEAEVEAAADLERRVVEVVTTVSVVQYVDGDGNSIDVSTLFTPPKTDAPDGVVALTVEGSASIPTVSVPGVSAVVSGVESLIGASAIPTGSVTGSTSSQNPALTSAPLTTSSLFPSLGAITNSSSISTAPSFSNSTTAHSLFANSTRTSSTFSSFTSSSSFSSSHSSKKSTTSLTSTSTWFSSSSTDLAVATGGAGDGSETGVGGSAPSATATGTGGGSDDSSGPETSQVVGGVVGGVAGLAVLVLLAMLLLKWKKRNGGHVLLVDGPGSSARALPAAGPSGGDGGGAGETAERSFPFAVPATLAALSGYKRSSKRISLASDSGEKGFQRISGRKLPSVLQYGGDGYHDPRQSALSDTSVYRDSMAFFNQPGTQRFALGSPMRPESGIQVMREGPQRTPITEQGPFYDQLTPPPPASPGHDPLGRSLVKQDGSRGSGSRFTENM